MPLVDPRRHATETAQDFARHSELIRRAGRASLIDDPVPDSDDYAGPFVVSQTAVDEVSVGGTSTRDIIHVPTPGYPLNTIAMASAETLTVSSLDRILFLRAFLNHASTGIELRLDLQKASAAKSTVSLIQFGLNEYWLPLAYITKTPGGVIDTITQLQYGTITVPFRHSRLYYRYDNRVMSYRYNRRSAGTTPGEVTVTLSAGAGSDDIYFGYNGGSPALQVNTTSLSPWWIVGEITRDGDNKATSFTDYSVLLPELNSP